MDGILNIQDSIITELSKRVGEKKQRLITERVLNLMAVKMLDTGDFDILNKVTCEVKDGRESHYLYFGTPDQVEIITFIETFDMGGYNDNKFELKATINYY